MSTAKAASNPQAKPQPGRTECDFETIGFISEFGAVPEARMILWIEGLKMAYEQLGDELPK